MTRPRPRPQQAQQAALSAALSGAIDLSGLKARADAARAQQQASPLAQQGATEQPGTAEAADAPRPPAAAAPAAAAPAPSQSPYVIDVTEANLQQVVEQSMQVPVVLEFWLANADQAQQYGDTLIRLAEQGQGSWLLGRVEVEQQMRVAQAMRLQGVPALRILAQGQMVDGIDGLLPEDELRKLLQAVVEQTGGTLPEGAGPAEDPRVEQAEDALATGDLERAEQLYQSLLADQPAHPLAKDAITQIRLMKRLDAESGDDFAKVLADADASPADVELACKAADAQVAAGQHEAAFERLLVIIRGGDADAKEAARQRLIELFAIVGNGDPAVAKARRDLASALF